MLNFDHYRNVALNVARELITIGLAMVFVSCLGILFVTLTKVDHAWIFVFDVMIGTGILMASIGVHDLIKANKDINNRLKSILNSEFAYLEKIYIVDLRKLASGLITRITKKNPGFDQAEEILLKIFYGVKMGIGMEIINATLYGVNPKLRVDYYPNLELTENGIKRQATITLWFPNNEYPDRLRSKDFVF